MPVVGMNQKTQMLQKWRELWKQAAQWYSKGRQGVEGGGGKEWEGGRQRWRSEWATGRQTNRRTQRETKRNWQDRQTKGEWLGQTDQERLKGWTKTDRTDKRDWQNRQRQRQADRIDRDKERLTETESRTEAQWHARQFSVHTAVRPTGVDQVVAVRAVEVKHGEWCSCTITVSGTIRIKVSSASHQNHYWYLCRSCCYWHKHRGNIYPAENTQLTTMVLFCTSKMLSSQPNVFQCHCNFTLYNYKLFFFFADCTL